MNCLIIASGDLSHPSSYRDIIKAADRIICADGGVRHARALNVIPDLVIGDLDSVDNEDERFLAEKAVPVIRHPKDKDSTDSELAVRWALQNGATSITLIGGTGTRLDHTLANLLLLKQIADRDIPGCVIDAHNEIYLVSRALTLYGTPGDQLSVIPVTEWAMDVSLTGVAFPLTLARIPLGSTLGISNRFVESTVTITLGQGLLLVTRSRD